MGILQVLFSSLSIPLLPMTKFRGAKWVIMSFYVKAAKSVTFDLLILELMFLFFKNTVKKTKIQVYILPIS